MTIHVLPMWEEVRGLELNVTTRGGEPWRRLSPMLLGPVLLPFGMHSENMENAWQYSKVYASHVDDEGHPTEQWWEWSKAGWRSAWANRYPMGKGAKPLYSYWGGIKMGYTQARREIYIPLYQEAVYLRQPALFARMKELAEEARDITIRDFDAYDHRALNYSWEDVINDSRRKMGHGFVLAMMLEGYL